MQQRRFEVLAKCCGSDFRPIYQNSKGWDSLQKALAVRDRLMHPKKVVDLDVTPNEFKEAQRASDWFASVFRIALHSHQASFFTLLGAFTDENSLLEKAQRMKQELPSMKEQLNEREKH